MTQTSSQIENANTVIFENRQNNPDVIEDTILRFDRSVLRLLLKDKTTQKNIIWATSDYESLGSGYEENSEILPELITGEHTLLIQPRSSKEKEAQEERTRVKAEVFTPSWVCNKQNNLVDAQWYGRDAVFNEETPDGWKTVSGKISFPSEKKNWKKYVDAQRLEITCGEAPYLVSRYDTVTGEIIPINDRIGLYDRKMRIVSENAADDSEWIEWSIRALQSVFGYEYQGDNLLLARENMLFSYVDYYTNRFSATPDNALLRKVANIIAWNLWQMDGMRFVVPNTCHEEEEQQIELFEEPQKIPCPGCKSGDPYQHNGIYCLIHDWRTKKSVRFIDMMKGAKS